LAPKSVTSNDLERRNGLLRYFTEFGNFGAHYIKVIKETFTACEKM